MRRLIPLLALLAAITWLAVHNRSDMRAATPKEEWICPGAQQCQTYVVEFTSCPSGQCEFPGETKLVAWCRFTGDPANKCKTAGNPDTCSGKCVNQSSSTCIVTQD